MKLSQVQFLIMIKSWKLPKFTLRTLKIPKKDQKICFARPWGIPGQADRKEFSKILTGVLVNLTEFSNNLTKLTLI